MTPHEQRAREGRGDDLLRAVLLGVHEVEVHAAELLDPLVLDRVEVGDLGAAVGGGLGLGEEGSGVVAAGLGVAHAAGDGADAVLREPDGDRLHAAGEVGAERARR